MRRVKIPHKLINCWCFLVFLITLKLEKQFVNLWECSVTNIIKGFYLMPNYDITRIIPPLSKSIEMSECMNFNNFIKQICTSNYNYFNVSLSDGSINFLLNRVWNFVETKIYFTKIVSFIGKINPLNKLAEISIWFMLHVFPTFSRYFANTFGVNLHFRRLLCLFYLYYGAFGIVKRSHKFSFIKCVIWYESEILIEEVRKP